MEAAHESQLTELSPNRAKSTEAARAALPVALALAAGLALRLWMLKSSFEVNGDTLIYGEPGEESAAARAAMRSRGPAASCYPTLIRLPGYPLFLALASGCSGWRTISPLACVQIALELAGCLLLADFARRIAPAGHEAQRSAGDALAGGALPVYGFVCVVSADRDADAICSWRWRCGRWRGSVSGRDGATRCGSRSR